MGKGNLLIIDDEDMILDSLKELLEDVATEIYTCSSGKDGLELLNKKEVHAIVCDINMPKMSGVEVIKKVREQNIETPFIFYTGHGTRQLMMEAIKYGAFDFIEKPNMVGLEEIVTRALKEGQKEGADEQDHAHLITEYQKMIQKLER